MRSAIISFILFFMISCLAHWPANDISTLTEGQKLKQISDDFWQLTLENAPTWATFIGNRQFDASLPDFSFAAIQKETENDRLLLGKLEKIKPNDLTKEEQMTREVLLQELRGRIDTAQCQNWLWSVDQLDGPQVGLAELPNYHTISSIKDAQNLIVRYQKMEGLYQQQIANLKEGMSKGYLPAKINVELVVNQLDRQLEVTPQKSPYFEMTKHFPLDFTDAQMELISTEALQAIQKSIYPGLLAYRNFLRDILLPKARNDVGLSYIPHGHECYAALIQKHTGLSLSAEAIHQLGLSEVNRIKKEMLKLIHVSNPHMDISQYKEMLIKKNKQHPKTRKDLLIYNQQLVAKAQGALPRAFTKIPKTPIEVKAIEGFREQEAPAAYYCQAPSDGSRPAFYYLNTYEPQNRLLDSMAVLAFHEALPGHHMQIALANENKSLPEFQRQLGQTAFIEGWALYAEGLAGELGLYETAAEKIGALNEELWRALRLVIDTGIHAKNWSREKAIEYLSQQSFLPKIEVINEIDRYIVWPAQALAYKIGQLEIRLARLEAEQKLGPKFSLSAFHDRLLQYGALPLPTMRRSIQDWIKKQESSSSSPGFLHRF